MDLDALKYAANFWLNCGISRLHYNNKNELKFILKTRPFHLYSRCRFSMLRNVQSAHENSEWRQNWLWEFSHRNWINCVYFESRCISREVYVTHKISCFTLKIYLGTHVQSTLWTEPVHRVLLSSWRIYFNYYYFRLLSSCNSKLPDVRIILCGNEQKKMRNKKWNSCFDYFEWYFGESLSMRWSRHLVITSLYFLLNTFYRNSVIAS